MVHLHGAKTAPDSDGYPEDWIVPGKSQLYHYPNQQDAAMLWYHDHAMGINRLNIYAGLFGAYLIRDGVEDCTESAGGQIRDSAVDFRPSAHPGRPALLSCFGQSRMRHGCLRFLATRFW